MRRCRFSEEQIMGQIPVLRLDRPISAHFGGVDSEASSVAILVRRFVGRLKVRCSAALESWRVHLQQVPGGG
jgi:hypothetical protein